MIWGAQEPQEMELIVRNWRASEELEKLYVLGLCLIECRDVFLLVHGFDVEVKIQSETLTQGVFVLALVGQCTIVHIVENGDWHMSCVHHVGSSSLDWRPGSDIGAEENVVCSGWAPDDSIAILPSIES